MGGLENLGFIEGQCPGSAPCLGRVTGATHAAVGVICLHAAALEHLSAVAFPAELGRCQSVALLAALSLAGLGGESVGRKLVLALGYGAVIDTLSIAAPRGVGRTDRVWVVSRVRWILPYREESIGTTGLARVAVAGSIAIGGRGRGGQVCPTLTVTIVNQPGIWITIRLVLLVSNGLKWKSSAANAHLASSSACLDGHGAEN